MPTFLPTQFEVHAMDKIAQIPPSRMRSVEQERARQQAAAYQPEAGQTTHAMRACRGDRCNQGRSKCPTPAACRLPDEEGEPGLSPSWEAVTLAELVALLPMWPLLLVAAVAAIAALW